MCVSQRAYDALTHLRRAPDFSQFASLHPSAYRESRDSIILPQMIIVPFVAVLLPLLAPLCAAVRMPESLGQVSSDAVTFKFFKKCVRADRKNPSSECVVVIAFFNPISSIAIKWPLSRDRPATS